jgi:hypothetical protein
MLCKQGEITTSGLAPNRSDMRDPSGGRRILVPVTVGDEQNGMPLSVVSAFTRLGLDPWEEGARLATLPKPQGGRGAGADDRSYMSSASG